MIPTNSLGNSGLKVTQLCLGTMTFGNQADEKTAFAIMDRAREGGINFFDTADGYPLGGSPAMRGQTEHIVGKWLKGRRHDVVLATKCFATMGSGPNDGGLSRKHIMSAIEDSLRRLGTDYIDLYQAHQYDPTVPVEETLRTFDDLVHQGKVRYIGVSNWRTWHLANGVRTAALAGLIPVVSVQPRYNLLFRMIEEELVPFCQSNGIGLITYNPLAGGLLTGRYQTGQTVEEGTRFGLKEDAGTLYQERYWTEKHFEVVEEFRNFCTERNWSLASTAVAWVLAKPGITSAIVGASKPEQLTASLGAPDIPLTPDDVKVLDELWYKLPRRYEYR